VFLVGAGLLVVHDGLEWLRLAVGVLQLSAGVLAGLIVLRITDSRAAAILTAPLVLLTPWAVHEHGALTPELVALPLLLGAALSAASDRRGLLTGVLCGLLPLVKFPFAIPAVVLLAVSADRRRSVAWAAGTLLAGLGLSTALAGGSFWRDTVLAQTQTGSRGLGQLKGFWAQAAWNVLGLLVCAAVGVWLRRVAVGARMLRVVLALAVAMIITFLTNFKVGTGLNVTVPVEAALVPLAVCGTAFALRSRGSRLLAGVCILAWLFTLGQSASLIASPHGEGIFLRAGSAPAWEVLMRRSQFDRAVARARACPPGVPYDGPPLIAFAAGRTLPAGQPDQFIVTHARALHAVLARVDAVRRVCP
jgi:hypothetical protein